MAMTERETMVDDCEKLREGDTPLGRADKMRLLMAFGKSEEQLAVLFGCSLQTVRNTLALLDCCTDVRKAVEGGQINVIHALKLGKLPPEKQRAKVAELVAAGVGTVGHAKARQQRQVMGDARPKVRTRKEIEERLATSDGEAAAALRWVLRVHA